MQKTSVFSDFYCLPNKLALMGLRPGLSSGRFIQIRFFSWPIWTAHEALTDPKMLGKKLSNEGHGFSRVPMSLRLTQGDENHLDSPIMILRGLEVVFDCAVNGLRA